jgi:hypothetical protein
MDKVFENQSHFKPGGNRTDIRRISWYLASYRVHVLDITCDVLGST